MKCQMGNKICSRKLKGVTALLNYSTVEAAAQSIGVGERTMYRWLEDPQFVEELHKSQEELLHLSSRRLVHLSNKAIDVIGEILQNPDASDSNRLRAIKIVFDQILKLRSLLEVEERIANIEEYIDGIVEDSTIFQ